MGLYTSGLIFGGGGGLIFGSLRYFKNEKSVKELPFLPPKFNFCPCDSIIIQRSGLTHDHSPLHFTCVGTKGGLRLSEPNGAAKSLCC